jgi:hypothetical protein
VSLHYLAQLCRIGQALMLLCMAAPRLWTGQSSLQAAIAVGVAMLLLEVQ